MIQRNQPCPCGSGKKYKKCCASVQEAATPPTPAADPMDTFQFARQATPEQLESERAKHLRHRLRGTDSRSTLFYDTGRGSRGRR